VQGVRLTFAKRASERTMAPCAMATVVPPRTLPSSTPQRGNGDTRTSRRKPNSRSQITDTADCTEVYSMFSAITAGKMNWRYVYGHDEPHLAVHLTAEVRVESDAHDQHPQERAADAADELPSVTDRPLHLAKPDGADRR
jgi:hypothetical protein